MNSIRIGISLALAAVGSLGVPNPQLRSLFVEVPFGEMRTVSDYGLTIDGVPVPILNLQASPQPLSAVVLLDVSSSIGPIDTSDIARRTANMVRLGDGIRLGTFADTILFSAKPIRDAASAVLAATEVKQPFGTSRLWDGLYEAARLISVQSGLRALVVFTDGMATGNERGFREASEYVAATGAVVCVVGVADSAWSPTLNAAMKDRSKRVREITEMTGGKYSEIRQRPFKPADAIAKLLGELRMRERLDFDSPVGDARWHDVSLVLRGRRLPAPQRLWF